MNWIWLFALLLLFFTLGYSMADSIEEPVEVYVEDDEDYPWAGAT